MAVATDEITSGPKYLKIAQYLRKRIEDGELQPGDRLPSFVEMRTDYGATPATVERVYADLERDDLIRREPNRGTFVAEKPRRRGTGLIGFVGSSFAARREPYFAAIVEGIEEVIWREERRILLLDANSPQGWDQVDGVLICRPHAVEQCMQHLPKGLPCVTLMAAVEGYSSVMADDFEGVRSAINHLIALGHRRIAYMIESAYPILRLRTAGYLDALRDKGIEADWLRKAPASHFDMNLDYREWGRHCMRQWLQEDWAEQNITAILAQNDTTALGIMESLQEAGIGVPDEVSVIGFDNIELCDCVTPSLTSIEVPLHKIAATGVELLLRHIASAETEISKTILPTKLRVRNSTASIRRTS